VSNTAEILKQYAPKVLGALLGAGAGGYATSLFTKNKLHQLAGALLGGTGGYHIGSKLYSDSPPKIPKLGDTLSQEDIAKLQAYYEANPEALDNELLTGTEALAKVHQLKQKELAELENIKKIKGLSKAQQEDIYRQLQAGYKDIDDINKKIWALELAQNLAAQGKLWGTYGATAAISRKVGQKMLASGGGLVSKALGPIAFISYSLGDYVRNDPELLRWVISQGYKDNPYTMEVPKDYKKMKWDVPLDSIPRTQLADHPKIRTMARLQRADIRELKRLLEDEEYRKKRIKDPNGIWTKRWRDYESRGFTDQQAIDHEENKLRRIERGEYDLFNSPEDFRNQPTLSDDYNQGNRFLGIF